MAVAIAKDVIKQTRGPLHVQSGNTYVVTSYHPPTLDCDLRDILPDMLQHGCTVCALGAALISKAKLFDAVPLRDLKTNATTSHYYFPRIYVTRALRSVFSDDTLDAIESAFEQFPQTTGRILYNAAIFGEKYGDDTERLIAIMENVIANNGEFVPPEATEEELAERNYIP